MLELLYVEVLLYPYKLLLHAIQHLEQSHKGTFFFDNTKAYMLIQNFPSHVSTRGHRRKKSYSPGSPGLRDLHCSPFRVDTIFCSLLVISLLITSVECSKHSSSRSSTVVGTCAICIQNLSKCTEYDMHLHKLCTVCMYTQNAYISCTE